MALNFPVKLRQAYYWNDGELKEWQFVSDGIRKPLYDEAVEILNNEFGGEFKREDIEGVYTVTDAYDYTTGKKFRIVLRAKKN